MKNKFFKAAVIGLGVGMHHIKALESHPNCVVKKVYDFDKSKILKSKKKYPKIEFVKNEYLFNCIICVALQENCAMEIARVLSEA